MNSSDSAGRPDIWESALLVQIQEGTGYQEGQANQGDKALLMNWNKPLLLGLQSALKEAVPWPWSQVPSRLGACQAVSIPQSWRGKTLRNAAIGIYSVRCVPMYNPNAKSDCLAMNP